MTQLKDAELDRMLSPTALPEARADLSLKIARDLSATLQAVTEGPSNGALALRFALVFVLVAAGLVGMMGAPGWKIVQPVQMLGMISILGAGVIMLSLVLAWQIRPGSWHRIPAKASWAYFATGFFAGAALFFPWRLGPSFVSQGWPCLLAGSAVAIPGGLLFWCLARRGVALSPVTLGGTLGAMSGGMGLTVLQFRCVYQHAAHLLLWHGGILVLSTGAGIWIACMIDRNQSRA